MEAAIVKKNVCINPFLTYFSLSVAFHIETSHLICIANQMTDFNMKCITGLKWVNNQCCHYVIMLKPFN